MAQIRATISQVEKYNSAVSTFRTKYGYLPGDIPSSQASQVGIFAVTGANANQTGYGDGDGRIAGAGNVIILNPWNGVGDTGEQNAFWRQLGDANLIDGQFGVTGKSLLRASDGTVSATLSGPAQIGLLYPQVKFGENVFITAFASTYPAIRYSGQNFFYLVSISSVSAAPTVIATVAPGPTPSEGYAIDSKMDDGNPSTGRVFDTLGFGAGMQGFECANVDDSSQYDLSSTYVDSRNCLLAIRFNWRWSTLGRRSHIVHVRICNTTMRM